MMTDLERAKADLLAAYRSLERAQEQLQAVQLYLRQCEVQKVSAQARVEMLENQQQD